MSETSGGTCARGVRRRRRRRGSREVEGNGEAGRRACLRGERAGTRDREREARTRTREECAVGKVVGECREREEQEARGWRL